MVSGLDDLRAARDAAITRWTDAAGGQSLCRPTGPLPQRHATKRAEGAATALRQVVRRIENEGVGVDAALTEALEAWRLLAASPRNDEWLAYAEGGLEALGAQSTHEEADQPAS